MGNIKEDEPTVNRTQMGIRVSSELQKVLRSVGDKYDVSIEKT